MVKIILHQGDYICFDQVCVLTKDKRKSLQKMILLYNDMTKVYNDRITNNDQESFAEDDLTPRCGSKTTGPSIWSRS